MNWFIFGKVAILSFTILLAIGPVALTIMNITINKGLVAGVSAALGVVSADFIFCIISVIALEIVSNNITGNIIHIFSLIGSMLLFYISYIFWKNNNKIQHIKNSGFRNTSNFKRAIGCFVLTISSPTTTFTYATVFSNFIGIKNTTGSLLLGSFTGTLTFYILYVSFFVLVRNKLSVNMIKNINKMSSIIIFIFAMTLLIKSIILLNKI